jgi:hypothetical protein
LSLIAKITLFSKTLNGQQMLNKFKNNWLFLKKKGKNSENMNPIIVQYALEAAVVLVQVQVS